jgi:hypothetical protein
MRIGIRSFGATGVAIGLVAARALLSCPKLLELAG